MKIPDLYEVPDLPDEIIEAAKDGKLVLFVGAGLSVQMKLPSWGGLAKYALEDLRHERFIDYSELEQLLALNDPKKQLSIAQIIADDNSYELDLAKHLDMDMDDEGIYRYVNDIGCSCVTTNYDSLLRPRYVDPTIPEGESAPITPDRVYKIDEHLLTRLNTPGTVIHIHGSIEEPASMIVTTSEYLSHYDSADLQHFLGELFNKKTVLFIGYSLEESEILEHILRRGGVRADEAECRRFVLQGYFKSNTPLYHSLHKYYKRSFGVQLIGFDRDRHNFSQLEEILKRWSELIEIRPQALVEDLKLIDEVLDGA
jgi:hypothetical protein